LDLEPLKIEREAKARRAAQRRSPWFARLVFLGLLIAAGFLFRRPLIEQIDRLSLPRVRIVQVAAASPLASSAVEGTSANGYVVARVRAALSADTPGRIVEMNVTEGSVVKKGDVVARLFSDEARAFYERAEADLVVARAVLESRKASRRVVAANLERAQASFRMSAAELDDVRATLHLAELELARSQKLVADKIASLDRLEVAQAQKDGAEARFKRAEAGQAMAREEVRSIDLELTLSERLMTEAEGLIAVKEAERDQAKASLDKTEVRAPFDGIVVLKDAEVGEVVSPNAVGAQSRGSVVTMVDFATLEVQVELPETSLPGVVLDAPARIFLDAYPERAYSGRVLRIWPTANRQKATVEVRVGFDDPDENLRPELGARVVFTRPGDEGEDQPALPSAPVILIPQSSVVTIDGKHHVFVLERDLARVRAVELGEERSGRVAVLAGLASGERIVDSPPGRLQDGDRVREEG